jgi:hypothetical protein
MSYSEFFRQSVEQPILNFFKEEFNSDCNAMGSTQNIWLQQNTKLIINGIIKNCTIKREQNLQSEMRAFCLDIPKLLDTMTPEQRTNIINKIVDKLRTELTRVLVGRTKFINLLCDKLKNELDIFQYVKDINDTYNPNKKREVYNEYKRLETSPTRNTDVSNNQIINNYKKSVNNVKKLEENGVKTELYHSIIQSCQQKLAVYQDQKIVINGNMDCGGRSFIISQDMVVDAQMNCFVKPLLNNIKNDPKLKRLYEEGDNACLYYIEYGKCIDGKREKNIKIISPRENCTNIIEQSFESCKIPKCSISNWSDWSVCNFTNGKATRFRTRKFIKQGEECNNVMKEVEECIIPDRYAGKNLIKQNALKYDLYDTYRGVLDKNTYILLFILLTILVLFVTIL